MQEINVISMALSLFNVCWALASFTKNIRWPLSSWMSQWKNNYPEVKDKMVSKIVQFFTVKLFEGSNYSCIETLYLIHREIRLSIFRRRYICILQPHIVIIFDAFIFEICFSRWRFCPPRIFFALLPSLEYLIYPLPPKICYLLEI